METLCESGQDFGSSHKFMCWSLCMFFLILKLKMGFKDGFTSFFTSFKNFLTMIKNFCIGIFDFVKGIFSFVKDTIDFIYKMFFIIFLCVIGYAGYIVFTSASNINKKIEELQTSIVYIKQVSDDLSKVTQKISNITNSSSKEDKKNNNNKSSKNDNNDKKEQSLTQKIKSFFKT